MNAESFDIAVIGGGTAGLAAAQTAAAEGHRVLLVEASRLGGECTWNGCVPSKALIEAARVYHTVSRASLFGIDVDAGRVDFARLMAHVADRIETIASYEDAAHLEKVGVVVRRARARLRPGPRLEVEGLGVETKSIVLCTGSQPAAPPIPGLADVPYLTNETLFSLEAQPRRLLVLGAGPVGLEMAHAFARLGTEVEVLDIIAELLPREDPAVAAVAHRLLAAEGLRFSLGVQVSRVHLRNGEYTLTLDDHGGSRTLAGDALLVATGRRPNIDALGLDSVGIRATKTGIAVDERMRTSVHTVFAAGDVTGILPFTHVAAYQGRIAAQNALGKRRKADYRVVPWVIFTDPEIAHVGLTEPEARREHKDVRCATLPFSAVDRALIQREPHGLIKVVTGRKSALGHAAGGEVLGAHIIGPGAGELIHEFALVMQTRAFTGRLAQTIHAYPSMSMAVQQAVAQLFPAGRAVAGDLREDLARAPEGRHTSTDEADLARDLHQPETAASPSGGARGLES